MLGLHYETPAAWAQGALCDPAALLLDHLFCERKAAAMALHTQRCFAQRFPKLKQSMAELAAEEFEHAERCEKFIHELGPEARASLARPMSGNKYAQGLRALWKNTHHDMFMDQLLVSSLIEARSAERFRLLADAAKGTTLGNFYEDLYASEVNHYVLFVGLSADFFGPDRTESRLEQMRADEARLIQSLPPGVRVHSGFA
jgi:tRNA 2-(methylsulfanyl)-N6-isopentenyladenosine37 hydroxylase